MIMAGVMITDVNNNIMYSSIHFPNSRSKFNGQPYLAYYDQNNQYEQYMNMNQYVIAGSHATEPLGLNSMD